jgi:hypothetical protein
MQRGLVSAGGRYRAWVIGSEQRAGVAQVFTNRYELLVVAVGSSWRTGSRRKCSRARKRFVVGRALQPVTVSA